MNVVILEGLTREADVVSCFEGKVGVPACMTDLHAVHHMKRVKIREP